MSDETKNFTLVLYDDDGREIMRHSTDDWIADLRQHGVLEDELAEMTVDELLDRVRDYLIENLKVTPVEVEDDPDAPGKPEGPDEPDDDGEECTCESCRREAQRDRDQMSARVRAAALRTWDAIGADYLRAKEECGEAPEIPRAHAIELVCDSDHLERHGADAEAVAWLRELLFEERDAVLKSAFRFETYG